MQCSPILLKIDMYVRYTMMHVWINPFCFIINIGMVPTSYLSYKIRFWQTFCTSLSSVGIHFQSNYNVNIMISWVAICKFMRFNIIFKTIFEYIHNKFCFVHTNTFCKYRKKLRASPRVHLVLIFQDGRSKRLLLPLLCWRPWTHPKFLKFSWKSIPSIP